MEISQPPLPPLHAYVLYEWSLIDVLPVVKLVIFPGRDSLEMHRVSINADRYTPVDSELLPTGEMAAVGGTKFDLRIARRLESVEEGLLARHHVTGTLFDHNFVLNRMERGGLTFAARVESGEKGGRCVL